MAVTLRLARHGRKKRPFYRIVAADSQMKRDGRYIELLGTLNPLQDPPAVTLEQERVRYWIGVGATPSDTVSSVIEREMPGFLSELEDKRKERIRSRRASRKAVSKGK